MRFLRLLLFPFTISVYCMALSFVMAQPLMAADGGQRSSASTEQEPTLVQADQMSYDQNTNTIVAAGHVEVASGQQLLHADKIIYDQNKNVITAKGNISVLQPSGEVMFADEAELTGDLKQGFVEKVKVLFPDNSRLVAQDAQRYEGRYLIADRGVYTACNLCADDPEKPPLWQLKGVRVTHDNEAHDVIYRDATLEFDGVPMFYTPYFSHPDATVKRRQGFLGPSGGFNQYVGTFARVPYYFDLAPNSDLTLMPVFSTNDHLQLTTQWRHRFENGSMQWDGSFTHTDLVDEYGVDQGKQWRGNLFGKSLFDLDNEWRAGTDVAFTSDKSYLRRYNITSEDMLTNRGYAEGFRGRNYAVSNLYYFQDLRPGIQPAQPFVVPEMRFSALGEPGKTLGGRWSLDGGMLVTTRDRSADPTKQGPDTRRLSFDAGWERQLVSTTGFLTEVSGFARADGYWADNVPDPGLPAGSGFSNITDVRQFAQSDVTVRYPLGRHGDGYQQIIEPIAMLSLAPQVSDNQKLPNEDSLDVEFDETNLFASNRFTGIDRIEGGVRTAYGIRHSITGDNGARIEMLGGQVFRVKRDDNFPEGSGLRDQFSDYVGRIDMLPTKWLDAIYGFRIDRKELNFQRQEARISAGVPEFRPYTRYLLANQTEATTGLSTHVEEGTIGFNSRFAKYYALSASYTYAFLPQPGPRTTTAGVSYQDECFQLGLTAQRDNTNRADVSTGTSVMFHFYLKNIGGVHTDSVGSGTFQQPGLTPARPTPEQNPEQP
ncbi:MAG: LPS assembly protein LptD [Alphaproteobacteria bacterium]|nr:LPS assembly protein LptD [Alphaproteobacteria bacterium]